MKSVVVSALVVVVAGVLLGACLVVADHVPYRYTISLDDPPEKRYYPAVFDLCRDDVHRENFVTLLRSLEGEMNKLGFSQAFQLVGRAFNKMLPEVYQELSFVIHIYIICMCASLPFFS